MGRGRYWGVLLAFAVLAVLVFAAQASSDVAAQCKGGEYKELDVGIVKAIGCWTQSSKEGATIYTGRFEDQGEAGIDMNGFIVNGPKGGALQVNTTTREVSSVALEAGTDLDKAQLNSKNWPAPGSIDPIGSPIKLDFIAPEKSGLLLEDLHLGANTVKAGLAGLSPVGDVETPVRLEPEGKGSMDLSVLLAGAFTLKGKPQSVTINLPTESGKGTVLDGFEIKLKQIDTFKVITLNEFVARYSASQKVISGSAVVTFPFSGPGKAGVGFGAGFALEDGTLTEVKANIHGVHIPIGAPPGGFITDLGGGFHIKNGQGKDYEILVMASTKAEIGPEVPTPWGKVAPIDVDAALQLGSKNGELFFQINGGVKVFRLDVGDVNLAIHNSGIEFGVGLGVGFPSYRNNENDPFYIGARVEGWVAKGKFQFEGSGRVALFGLKIFDGRVLVNDRAAGACWVVLGFPGGAVYEYGAAGVKTFGIGCGLDDYKEKFPEGATASAGGSRTIRLTHPEGILKVHGKGAAPSFTLRSAAGQVIHSPVNRESSIQRSGFKHAFFVNQSENTTYVIMPRPQGLWTITPDAGSVPITSVKSGRKAPGEQVEAEVRGSGRMRTLVWNSLNRPDTRLQFIETLPNGSEVPVLETGKAAGRERFAVAPGSYSGKRRLRAVVVEGYGARQAPIVDTYRVKRPAPLSSPKRVSSWRDEHTVHVRWSGVKEARSYLVEVSMHKHGKLLTNYVRHVSARRRSVVIRHHPGGGRAVAKVFAINYAGRLGKPGANAFSTNPPNSDLQTAARRSASSAVQRGGGMLLTSLCPPGGHCRVLVELRFHGRVVARSRFQQTPDTFNRLWVTPRSKQVRKALRAGEKAQVVVRTHRIEHHAVGLASIGS